MYLHRFKKAAASFAAIIFPLGIIYRLTKRRYIFCYHRVVPKKYAAKFSMHEAMWISPETFSDDISWMKLNGEIVSLDSILDFSQDNDRPLFSITFDDGWVDNYDYAFPILKEHNVTATIFLVTNAINTGEIFWVEDFLYKISALNNQNSAKDNIIKLQYICKKHDLKDYEDKLSLTELGAYYAEFLKTKIRNERNILLMELYECLGLDSKLLQGEILTWDQIREMKKYGIKFGSHTHRHEILEYADNDLISEELKVSKNILEDKLGDAITLFCYPNARYRQDNSELLRESGYKYGFILGNKPCESGNDDYYIPRFLLCERMSINKDYLLCKLLKLPLF